jgi:hypothetical protein
MMAAVVLGQHVVAETIGRFRHTEWMRLPFACLPCRSAKYRYRTVLAAGTR